MTVVKEARKLGREIHCVKPAVYDISMEGIQVLPDKKNDSQEMRADIRMGRQTV